MTFPVFYKTPIYSFLTVFNNLLRAVGCQVSLHPQMYSILAIHQRSDHPRGKAVTLPQDVCIIRISYRQDGRTIPVSEGRRMCDQYLSEVHVIGEMNTGHGPYRVRIKLLGGSLIK